MEYQEIINLLDTTSDNVPWFITKNGYKIMINLIEFYSRNKQIRFKTSMLQSDLCDCSDAYIVTRGTITVKLHNKRDKKYVFSI